MFTDKYTDPINISIIILLNSWADLNLLCIYVVLKFWTNTRNFLSSTQLIMGGAGL